MAEQRETQESGRFDAFELWRQWYEANEQAWTKALKDMTTSQSYAEAQGKMLEVFLSYQKLIRDAMSTQLSALNLPSRDDIGRLGELVVGLEEKVDQLDEALDATEGQVQQLVGSVADLAQRIARLDETVGQLDKAMDRSADKAMDKIDGKVQRLVDAIDGLSHKIARLEAQVAIQAQPGQDDQANAVSDQTAGQADAETAATPGAARGSRSSRGPRSS